MADTSKLQKKGSPPKRAESKNTILLDLRNNELKNKPLQVMVSPDIFEEFSAEAGKRFGFSKGAKSKLFLEMWDRYYSM